MRRLVKSPTWRTTFLPASHSKSLISHASIRTLNGPLPLGPVHCGILILGAATSSSVFSGCRQATGPGHRTQSPGRDFYSGLVIGLGLGVNMTTVLFFGCSVKGYLEKIIPSGCLLHGCLLVIEWFINLAGHPQSVQQYSEFPGHSDYCPLFGYFAAALGKTFTETF